MSELTTLLRKPELWVTVVKMVNSDQSFKDKVAHLVAVTVSYMIDDDIFYLEYHRGTVRLLPQRPVSNIQLALSGSSADWLPLLTGKIPYVRAIHFQQGAVKISGNGLYAAWLTPALSEFFRQAGLFFNAVEVE